jgi:hypothetical protein
MCESKLFPPLNVHTHSSDPVTLGYVKEMSGSSSAEAHVAVQVRDIAALLLERLDQLTDEMTLAIQRRRRP